MAKQIVLAFSEDFDTSSLVPWLQASCGCNVTILDGQADISLDVSQEPSFPGTQVSHIDIVAAAKRHAIARAS